MSSQLDDMYREVILDHYRSPRGKKPLPQANVLSDGTNPACGDQIELTANIENGVLTDVHVDCKGCAISVASGSMLAEAVKGRPFEEVRKLAEAVRKMLKGDETVQLPVEFEDIESLKGVRQFPVRVKCALLAWVTLVDGLERYASGKGDKPPSISTEQE
jgi:nitrogen fixation protein NifU and related proteins